MMLKNLKQKLPLFLILIQFLLLFSSCKMVQWGGGLSALDEDLSTTYYFYKNEEDDSPYVTKQYFIGNLYDVPSFTAEELISFDLPGYLPSGWKLKDASQMCDEIILNEDGSVNKYTVSYSSISFVPSSWNAQMVNYTVQHYKETLAGDYELADTEILQGITNSLTNAVVKTYTGFTAKTFENISIAGDGSTVLKIYYNRNSYTVEFEPSNVNGVLGQANPRTFNLKYGSPFPSTTVIPPPGYRLKGWSLDGTNIISVPLFVTEDVILIAVYELDTASSGNITVTITPSPGLSAGDVSRIECSQSGDNYTFTFNSTGTAYVDYTWYVNGAGSGYGAGTTYDVDASTLASGHYDIVLLAQKADGTFDVYITNFVVARETHL